MGLSVERCRTWCVVVSIIVSIHSGWAECSSPDTARRRGATRPERPLALLLGFGPQYEEQAAFRTTLLVLEDGVRVALDVPGLVVPRRNGFWRVGVQPPQPLSSDEQARHVRAIVERPGVQHVDWLRQRLPEAFGGEQGCLWYDWALWSAPLGAEPVLLPRIEDPDGDLLLWGGVMTLGITWVGTDHVSMIDHHETHGRYLTSVTAPKILALNDIARDGYAPWGEGSAWQPRATPDSLARDLERCVDESDPESYNSRSMLETAQQYWSIHRGHARWEFEWSFDHGSGALRGYGTACTTSLRPPRALVGHDLLAVPWSQVLHAVPAAKTAFSSPDGAVTVAVTDGEALAFASAERQLGRSLGVARVPVGPVVMGQWAVGLHVGRWVTELERARDLGMPALRGAAVPERARGPQERVPRDRN